MLQVIFKEYYNIEDSWSNLKSLLLNSEKLPLGMTSILELRCGNPDGQNAPIHLRTSDSHFSKVCAGLEISPPNSNETTYKHEKNLRKESKQFVTLIIVLGLVLSKKKQEYKWTLKSNTYTRQ